MHAYATKKKKQKIIYSHNTKCTQFLKRARTTPCKKASE